MPFDGTVLSPITARVALAAALREQLPENFRWNYCGTLTCAMGLAQAIGLIRDAFDDNEIENVFGLTTKQASDVFYGGNEGVWRGELCPFYGCESQDVSPEMVADALEALSE